MRSQGDSSFRRQTSEKNLSRLKPSCSIVAANNFRIRILSRQPRALNERQIFSWDGKPARYRR
jgi:hypothetical protein